MKKCPACGYLMDDFDPICPRCQGRGLSPDQAAVLAAQKAAALPKPPPSPVDLRQDVINGLMGALIFVVPAVILLVFFAWHLHDNSISTNQKYRGDFRILLGGIVMFAPLFTMAGAALGLWIGASLPQPNRKLSALVGGACLCGLTFISPFIAYSSEAGETLLLWFLFLLTVSCGAVGSLMRGRYHPQQDDSLLIRQIGVAVLCFIAPLIGFFVSISLGKNGSEYAAPALYGSIAGFIVIGLPFLSIVLGH